MKYAGNVNPPGNRLPVKEQSVELWAHCKVPQEKGRSAGSVTGPSRLSAWPDRPDPSGYPVPHLPSSTERTDWRKEDPQFIAEVLFAVTSMLSFTRLAYILPAHETLGTLQISIGKMIDDMIRFMFIMMIILTAFLCGMNNIYVHYRESKRLGSFNKTFEFLFWTMMGMEEHDVVDMPEFAVAEKVGQVLYGIFTIVMVVVLLNMLIAMITNSFQKIENDADVEWKFARSKLYLSFFREGLTLPVPFNIIPSPKSIFYAIRGSFRFMCCGKSKKNQKYPPINTISNPSMEEGGTRGETRLSYRRQVLKALVQRYIDTARRELEESRRKDLGNRLTELNKSVLRLHTEMKTLRQSVATNGLGGNNPMDGASVLRKYIMKVRNSFQNYEPEVEGDGQGSPVDVMVHPDGPLIMQGALPLLREEKEGEAAGKAEGESWAKAVEEEVGGETEEEVAVTITAEEEEEETAVVIAPEEEEEEVAVLIAPEEEEEVAVGMGAHEAEAETGIPEYEPQAETGDRAGQAPES
ncbi:short transient receptor potential channel 2 homolog [Erythrolamprus reginae]|uniref:short transient receptor potential channel 2 homolog n=1 Tax=Erythrolamprus reginae TaxID=121349 RepID=UPI00396C8E0A